MDISFVIITNGQKPDKLSPVLKAIRHQKIKNYEIFISGDLDKIKEEELEALSKEEWFKIRCKNESVNQQVKEIKSNLEEYSEILKEIFKQRKSIVSGGDDLAPGV